MPELANRSNSSPNDRRREEDWDDRADKLLGLVGSADVGEPLEHKIPDPNFQESCHENSEKLSWEV